MRDRDDEPEDDGEATEEDLVALQAIAALLDVEGDDELAWAQREALAAVGDEALALKARREKRERREAAERRARLREQREQEERARQEERAAREEAERVEAAWQARAARRAAEERAWERARAERRERARREEEARRKAQRRPVVERRPVPPADPRPTPPMERSPRPGIVARPPVVAPRIAPTEAPAERQVAPVTLVKEPDRGHQAEQATLTGADLAGWRKRLGLTQQAAADRLGVRQGTVSKAEGKPRAVLGPALRDALAGALRSESRIA